MDYHFEINLITFSEFCGEQMRTEGEPSIADCGSSVPVYGMSLIIYLTLATQIKASCRDFMIKSFKFR
jgi:hypothetical protein